MTPAWLLEIVKAAAATIELIDAMKDHLARGGTRATLTPSFASSRTRRKAWGVEQHPSSE